MDAVRKRDAAKLVRAAYLWMGITLEETMALFSRSLCGAAVAAFLLAAPGAAFAAAVVPLDHFNQVELHGGGHVVLRHGAAQSVTLAKGSTDHTHFTIKDNGALVIDACDANCPHEYDLEIDIVSPDIAGVAISGGGAIVAEGTFPNQARIGAAVSGGGDIDIRAMSAAEVDAAVNGGGKILTAPDGALNAAVNGGGNITYWGNPKVSEAVAGGGSVRRGG
jgi:Putative auto-transporter adhesin, head GIN domain